MKMKLAVLSILAFTLGNSAFANGKIVSVPFIHLAVPAEGLVVQYSLAGQHPQKISCVFENFYKADLKYTENSIEQDAGIIFGGGNSGDQFYFSNKEQKWDASQGIDSLNQYHVDEKGFLAVISSSYRPATPYATCIYTSEASN